MTLDTITMLLILLITLVVPIYAPNVAPGEVTKLPQSSDQTANEAAALEAQNQRLEKQLADKNAKVVRFIIYTSLLGTVLVLAFIVWCVYRTRNKNSRKNVKKNIRGRTLKPSKPHELQIISSQELSVAPVQTLLDPHAKIAVIDEDAKWEVVRTLGSGNNGKVDLAVRCEDGAMFAVKTLHANPTAREIHHLIEEIKCLSKLRHENIVKCYGASSTEQGVFLYMEYVSGESLGKIISRMGHLPLSLVRIYTEQMLQGLKFMHANSVIHRDLKPANVMVTTQGNVKLVDFGTAFDTTKLTSTIEQTIIGTPAFIAPEVVRRKKHTLKTDIWSLGVTVYKMITGKLPFRNYDIQQLLLDIATGSIDLVYPDDFPKHAKEFIDACINFNPEDRPSAETLLGYKFIMSPSERGTVDLHSLTMTLEINNKILDTNVAFRGDLSESA